MNFSHHSRWIYIPFQKELLTFWNQDESRQVWIPYHQVKSVNEMVSHFSIFLVIFGFRSKRLHIIGVQERIMSNFFQISCSQVKSFIVLSIERSNSKKGLIIISIRRLKQKFSALPIFLITFGFRIKRTTYFWSSRTNQPYFG